MTEFYEQLRSLVTAFNIGVGTLPCAGTPRGTRCPLTAVCDGGSIEVKRVEEEEEVGPDIEGPHGMFQ